ncbi:putative MFS-type transporter C16A3.17c [Daldinia childiae]|uniref:putative MFS-type transporter C16A3.17c n=1 Tax=Daldinia childiae TaxID=326645 RepID=UPI001445C84E|nr:putative MFS-type transporter C16A3.17c [Daldinia childiae]KAF3061049.1 putative MFS-type transporter C16A3.17c [Daldinia childiae]
MLFLTSIDTTIATTSVVAITRDLGGFEMSSWILTSYQLGYVAVIVVFAKFSDILGRKSVFVFCIIMFTAFSAGCAASQTLAQLIIMRAFQGLGGGGCFALSAICLIESVPQSRYADTMAKNGVFIILATVLGPILGGVISEHTTWRWIFIIKYDQPPKPSLFYTFALTTDSSSAPIGLFAIVIALIGIPNGYPHQGRMLQKPIDSKSKRIWAQIDLPGSALLIMATLSFTACFQEADSSGFVFVGAPLAVVYFLLPQRFQLVNGISSLDAGVRVLPFGISSSAGVVLSGRIASKAKVPGIYLVLIGAILQVIGFALLSTLSSSETIEPAIYGYMVLPGLGTGFCYSTMIIMIPFVAKKCDGSVAIGAANQFRTMGGAIGLAITTSIFNGYVASQLSHLGIEISITELTSTAKDTLPEGLQTEIRSVLSDAYNRQMLVLCAFGAAQVPVALFLWKRKQIVTA